MTEELPEPELLRKLLRYEPDTGKLFWRERTPDMFQDGLHTASHTCNRWNSRCAGKEAFTTINTGGYLFGTLFNHAHRAHRVIFAMMEGEWPADQIDHINGVKADNRWENLRAVSGSENNKNMTIPRNNTSGRVGVYWCKGRSRWVAQIRGNRKTVHLGNFVDKEQAVLARICGERKYGYYENHRRSKG